MTAAGCSRTGSGFPDPATLAVHDWTNNDMGRAVVTGIGMVSALGTGVDQNLDRLRRSVSGVGPISLFGARDLPVKTAGQVADLPPAPPNVSRGGNLLLRAAREAVRAASLPREDPVDLFLATSLGGMEKGSAYMREVLEKGIEAVDPHLLRDFLPASQPALLASGLGLRGRTALLNNACSSGTDALGMAMERIRDGRTRRAIAGGYDPLCEFVLRGFASLMIVTPSVCRPFDRERNGMVLGEAASVFVVEEESEAQKRGARPLGVLRGFGAANDAHHMTQPNPDGYAIARAMTEALETAGIEPSDVGYLNLHGTGTRINDVSEAHGVRAVFKDAAARLDCSSTKALTGHALAAAGAVEAAFCVLALREGFLPASAGLVDPDPDLPPLGLVRETRNKTFRFAMSNSLGFGGGASALVLENAGGTEDETPA